MRQITADLIRAALACIPPDLARDEWARVAMAIKAEMGADGFDLFDNWSQGGERYSKPDTRDTWQSIKAGGRVQIGTLFHIAKGHGFKWDEAPQVQPLSQEAQQAQHKARQAREQAEEREKAQRHQKTAQRAAHEWAQASEQGASAYLTAKGVQAHGLRFEPDGALLVPMRDAAGKLWNLQRIAPQKPASGSTKRFLKGGRVTGLMHWIGEPSEAAVLILCEGLATALSLHEATGHPVCVAFSVSGMAAVSKIVRGMWPSALLVLAGDNDKATEASTGRNPGKEKALQVAKAVQGVATWPEGLADGLTDFNDSHMTQGLEAVKDRIQEAIQSMQDKSNKASQEGQAISKPAVPDVPAQVDRFLVSDEGVFHLGQDREGRAMAPLRICGRLDVLARTRDEDGLSWGYLLAFKDPAGVPRTWAMPARMLAGDGGEYRATLMHMGFIDIASGASARNLLTKYLQSRQPAELARCADRIGWFGKAFVLPHETIGDADERIVFQSDGLNENPFKRRGTLSQWREHVAKHCVGNDRMLFAISCAFAGPLLHHSGMDGGGFSFRGGTSSGKSTALYAAGSVFGAPDFVKLWRSSDNGLESLAVQRNGTLLVLDELAQVDPKVAGSISYMLANGSGKLRAAARGGMRQTLRWQLLFLSAGEVSLAQHMSEAGQKTRAGQELRLVDIPADAGTGGGLYNTVSTQEDGAALSTLIRLGSAAYYGTAGHTWLKWLTDHHSELYDRVRGLIDRYSAEWVPSNANGQVHRVARRFALVAAGGELASEAGVTGWASGEAARGVLACFNAWIASRGGIGDAEVFNMLRQVQRLLEERGASNFAWMNRAGDDRAPNPTERWGFRRLVDKKGKPITRVDDGDAYGRAVDFLDEDGTEVEYFVLAEAFRSKLCEGYDHVAVARLLHKRGHLMPEGNARLDRKERVKGLGLVRVYRIKASVLSDDGGDN